MKRIARAAVAILLMLSASGTAHAEGGTRKVGGLKTWTNSWTRQVPGSERMNSNHVMLVGWGAEVLFSNRIFLEASYLFSFQQYAFNQPAPASQQERQDVDAALGYQFHRNIGCFVGARSTQMFERGTQYKETLSGALVGVRGTTPLIGAVSLFGRLTYLPLNKKETRAATTEHEQATGWFAAAGITYDVTRSITGSLGYQYEALRGETTSIKDTFAGLTFDLMYFF
jgi:opacity protein-like surface antigen